MFARGYGYHGRSDSVGQSTGAPIRLARLTQVLEGPLRVPLTSADLRKQQIAPSLNRGYHPSDLLSAWPDDIGMILGDDQRRLDARMAQLKSVLPIAFHSRGNKVQVYDLSCVLQPLRAECKSAVPVFFPEGLGN